MNLRHFRFDLPLTHPFTISRGTMTSQETMIVELEQEGVRGLGEATTNSYYGVTYERMAAALAGARGLLAETKLTDPADLWTLLAPVLGETPFAQCALDQAAHDLWGKLRGAPVYRLWGLNLDRVPASDFTIGIDTIGTMIAKLREMPGWPIYKIKLGTPRDREIIAELRKHTPATFRVDANCGWTADETIANSRVLKELGVEFIEQPLPPERDEEMPRVRAESALPIIADESCQVESDVERCVGRFHGINIKLPKCGGLTPARRMIAAARSLGLKVMIGCMTESSVSISATAQLLPLVDYADLDGAVLLARDIARGVKVERGVVSFPASGGCGVELLPEAMSARA